METTHVTNSQADKTVKLTHISNRGGPSIRSCRAASERNVKGSAFDITWSTGGNMSIGKNTPDNKNMGNDIDWTIGNTASSVLAKDDATRPIPINTSSPNNSSARAGPTFKIVKPNTNTNTASCKTSCTDAMNVRRMTSEPNTVA